MADIVDLRTRQPTSHDDEFNSQLVTDLARFAEGLVTEKDIRRRYKFDESTWTALGENETLFAAIEDEKTRRVRNGALKRERAQALVTSAPGVLGEILLAKDANPRHRIDSAKLLNDFSANGPEGVPAADRFQIIIRLDADTTIQFDKGIEVNPNDHDPHHPDDRIFPAIAVKKTTEDGGGENTL